MISFADFSRRVVARWEVTWSPYYGLGSVHHGRWLHEDLLFYGNVHSLGRLRDQIRVAYWRWPFDNYLAHVGNLMNRR